MTNLPSWWEPWIPLTCSKGHALKPGTVKVSPEPCGCPGAANGWHTTNACRVCNEKYYPPEHDPDFIDERPAGRLVL